MDKTQIMVSWRKFTAQRYAEIREAICEWTCKEMGGEG